MNTGDTPEIKPSVFEPYPERRAHMKVNVGGTDRSMRIVIGVILITLAVLGVVGWWGWLGVIALITGLFRFCPLYPLLGINTCRK